VKVFWLAFGTIAHRRIRCWRRILIPFSRFRTEKCNSTYSTSLPIHITQTKHLTTSHLMTNSNSYFQLIMIHTHYASTFQTSSTPDRQLAYLSTHTHNYRRVRAVEHSILRLYLSFSFQAMISYRCCYNHGRTSELVLF
jgi:hypothetical protein